MSFGLVVSLRCSQHGTSGALELRGTRNCMVLLCPTGRKPQGDVLSTAFSKGRVQRVCLSYKHKACLGRAWDVSVRSAFQKSKKSLSPLSVSLRLNVSTGLRRNPIKDPYPYGLPPKIALGRLGFRVYTRNCRNRTF